MKKLALMVALVLPSVSSASFPVHCSQPSTIEFSERSISRKACNGSQIDLSNVIDPYKPETTTLGDQEAGYESEWTDVSCGEATFQCEERKTTDKKEYVRSAKWTCEVVRTYNCNPN
ncbi:MAG: hypothetical protein GW917_00655 [Bdellovibrionales bacterium]|nr:hypothetical protein [Bdellovibrionales bacterium]